MIGSCRQTLFTLDNPRSARSEQKEHPDFWDVLLYYDLWCSIHPMDMEKSQDKSLPSDITGSLWRLRFNRSGLYTELDRLSRHYKLIGSVKHHDEHTPRPNAMLLRNDFTGWAKAVLFGDEVVIATDIAEVAVCSALFGDLNCLDERNEVGAPLVSHEPPYFGWRPKIRDGSAGPHYKDYDIYATPQSINAARLMGPALKGYIDIVAAKSFESILNPSITKRMHEDYTSRSISRREIYSVSRVAVKSLATIEVDGTDLPIHIQPYVFSDTQPHPFNERSHPPE